MSISATCHHPHSHGMLQVSVKSANMYPSLKPVVHTDSNDNDELQSDRVSSIRNNLCPFPLPTKYELLPVPHTDVTMAKQADCPGK